MAAVPVTTQGFPAPVSFSKAYCDSAGNLCGTTSSGEQCSRSVESPDADLQAVPRSTAGNAELAARGSHALPVLEPDHKTHSLVYHRTFPPWHVVSALKEAQRVTRCLRRVLLPMSWDAQANSFSITYKRAGLTPEVTLLIAVHIIPEGSALRETISRQRHIQRSGRDWSVPAEEGKEIESV